MRCVKCTTGLVIRDPEGELYCLNCGWRETAPDPGPLRVTPFTQKERMEIVAEFGSPREGLLEETEERAMKLKWMLQDSARRKEGGRTYARTNWQGLHRKVRGAFSWSLHSVPRGVYVS